jgi:hypothetical protein
MPEDTTPPNEAGEDAVGKWEELVDEWTDCAKAALDRAAERARDNVKLARAGKYGLGAYLDDVRWFMASVAEDASHLADTVQDSTASRARPEREGGG